MELTPEIIRHLKKFQQQEITGSILYKKLAGRQKDENNRKVLEKISADEAKHYEVYKSLTKTDIAPNKFTIFYYTLFARLLGPTFILRLMERNEENDQELYRVAAHLPNIPEIIRDEEEHEHRLMGMLKEERINYLGSVVLGLNDALVELTGALAGLTFALRNSNLIALTGLITGIAAAFSMAASEYLSTKSEETSRSAVKASVYTGVAYILTVALLILPYLLLSNIYISLGLTLSGAVLVIAIFNYYYAVVKNEKFGHRFGEMVLLSFGVAFFSFGVGYLLRIFFNLDV
jgi:vacuolar iron transporter family protein